jgi:hypothetical protein
MITCLGCGLDIRQVDIHHITADFLRKAAAVLALDAGTRLPSHFLRLVIKKTILHHKKEATVVFTRRTQGKAQIARPFRTVIVIKQILVQVLDITGIAFFDNNNLELAPLVLVDLLENVGNAPALLGRKSRVVCQIDHGRLAVEYGLGQIFRAVYGTGRNDLCTCGRLPGAGVRAKSIRSQGSPPRQGD